MVSKSASAVDSHASLNGALPQVKAGLQEALREAMSTKFMSETVCKRVEDYYKECIDYNIVGGKLTRARTVCEAVRICGGSSDQMQAALVLGWAVEILQAFFLVEDDVMDNGEQRRGRPCWFRLPRVGVANAINDGLLLEQLLYRLVESNKYTRPFALDACSLLRGAAMRTVLGQHLDTCPPPSVLEFTREQWLSVVRFKTAFYTFILPLELGILVSSRHFSPRDVDLIRSIGLRIGELFQAQDDMLDCFADASVIGKIGRDIEEGKCTWLLYTALEVLQSNQVDSALLDEFISLFGISARSPAQVARVKEIYKSIGIEQMFEEYSLLVNGAIEEDINRLESPELQELCRWLHATTHKRKM